CSVVLTHIYGASVPVIGSSGIFGVDLFFVLSGYLMTITYRKNRTGYQFIKSRILRIYPPYLVLSLPLIIFSYFYKNISASDIFHNITLLPTIHGNYDRINFVCWTLTYELYFYIVFSLCMYIFKGARNVILSTSFTMLVLFFLAGGVNGGLAGWKDNSIHHMIGNYLILDFILGSLIGLAYNGYTYKKNAFPILLSIAIIITSCTIIGHIHLPEPYNNYQLITFLTSGIPACVVIYITSKVSVDKIPLKKALIYIGTASYSIYLTHLYAVFAFSKLTHNNAPEKFLCFVTSIVIGCVAYYTIERKIIIKKKNHV
ncbi:acyltransferase, partial [Klebsiella pneumoniae]